MSNVKQAIKEVVFWKLTEGERALLEAQSRMLPTEAHYANFERSLQTIRSLRAAMSDKLTQDAGEAISWLTVAAAELRQRGGDAAAPSVEQAIRHVKEGHVELLAEK